MTHHKDQIVEPNHVPDLQNYLLSRDRGRRIVNPPVRYIGIVNLIALAFNVYESDGNEPQSYKQTLKSKFWNLWHKVMEDEMLSLKVNYT